jgi:hypothetical protein
MILRRHVGFQAFFRRLETSLRTQDGEFPVFVAPAPLREAQQAALWGLRPCSTVTFKQL